MCDRRSPYGQRCAWRNEQGRGSSRPQERAPDRTPGQNPRPPQRGQPYRMAGLNVLTAIVIYYENSIQAAARLTWSPRCSSWRTARRVIAAPAGSTSFSSSYVASARPWQFLEFRPSRRSSQTAATRRPDGRARDPGPHPSHQRIPVAKAALAYDSALYRSQPETGRTTVVWSGWRWWEIVLQTGNGKGADPVALEAA